MALWSIVAGQADQGWTMYAPYSLSQNPAVLWMMVAAFILGFSSILTGLNFIVTMHNMRAPGLTWYRLPLFVWAMYATAIMQIFATPVLAITLVLLLIENFFRIGIFDPALGGDPLLMQHFFWFYSHPAVYIIVVPGFGITSELITAFSKRDIFGYRFIAYSSVAIAIIGFLVWGHHMFVAGQSRARRHHVLLPHLLHRHPLGHQGLQLDHHPVQGLHRPQDPDAVRACSSCSSSPSAASPASSWPSSRWTSTCTTPTSSWPTSTT